MHATIDSKLCMSDSLLALSLPHTYFTVANCSLQSIENGNVTHTNTTLGGVATYTCDTGFILIGDIIRTCQDDSTWTGMDPSCISLEGMYSK